MLTKFYIAEHSDRLFLAKSLDNPRLVTLRETGSKKILSGYMHADLASAEKDAAREPGMFEGVFLAVVELQEVTPDEAEEWGAKFSSDPEFYRASHKADVARLRSVGTEEQSGPRRK